MSCDPRGPPQESFLPAFRITYVSPRVHLHVGILRAVHWKTCLGILSLVLALGACSWSTVTHHDEVQGKLVLRRFDETWERCSLGGCGTRRGHETWIDLRTAGGKTLLERVDILARSGDGRWALVGSSERPHTLFVVDILDGRLHQEFEFQGSGCVPWSRMESDSKKSRFLLPWREVSTPSMMGETVSVQMITLSEAGGTVDQVFRESESSAEVRPEAFSPDGASIAFFVENLVDGLRVTSLMHVPLSPPRQARTVSTHRRNADDMRIEWSNDGPKAYPP